MTTKQNNNNNNTFVMTASLDEMQLACDPSDPAFQFRTSATQVNDWIQGAARSHTSNLVKFQQAVQKQKSNNKNNDIKTNSNKTGAAVACSIRRFRQFARTAASNTTSTASSFSSSLNSTLQNQQQQQQQQLSLLKNNNLNRTKNQNSSPDGNV